MSDRARAELKTLPRVLPGLDGQDENYPVSYSEHCRAGLGEVEARLGG
jgi:hypothetical protein